MPIPDYESLMSPLLRLFSNGVASVADCVPKLKEEFDISNDEAEELIPSGRLTILQSRAHWARTYLSKAGLLESPRRGLHMITERGRRVLAQYPKRIDNNVLDQFEEFVAWRGRTTPRDNGVEAERKGTLHSVDRGQTPEDAMERAYNLLSTALQDELLSLVQQVSPKRFERVILDMLSSMGYGGGKIGASLTTKDSGDDGIDGIVNEDALGLDAVYVQAKRYSPGNKVGRPDIQRFVGSLEGVGASKGVFVTTSDFSRDAVEYVSRVSHRLVLINGQRLAQLMEQFGIGVRARATYIVSSIDEDYFSDVLQM